MSVEFKPELIRASAGTGKTFSLANRYIGLLVAGELPERILATTFTRKAAGEISERVFLRLAEATLSDEQAEELGSFIGQKNAKSALFGEKLLALVREQHRLHISTLDSFFSQIATSFGFELGLEAGWRIPEVDEERLIESEAVHALLIEASTEHVTRLMQLLHGGLAKKGVAGQLRFYINILHKLYCETDERAWVWLKDLKPAGGTGNAKELALEFASGELPVTKQGKVRKHWKTASEKDIGCNRS